MRIPAEIIPPIGTQSKEPDNTKKAEPVGNAAELATGFPESAPDDQSPLDKQEAVTPPAAVPARTTDGSVAGSQAIPVERRQAERRSENRPVLLDTRSKRGRRLASGDVHINIKV